MARETYERGVRAARRGDDANAQELLHQAANEEPENELAWLWLARVTPGDANRAGYLAQALALNPANKWAEHELAVARGEAKPGDIFGTSDDKELEALSCPNCAGALELKRDDSKTCVCPNCDSIVQLTDRQASLVGTASKHNPSVPITLGMKGVFDNVTYEVIGWLRFEGSDDEDTWIWEEWLLESRIKGYRWLSWDAEAGFNFCSPLPIEGDLDRMSRHISVNGKKARVIESGLARIVAVAGELTWRATIGDSFWYFDAKDGSKRYSAEFSTDEVELYACQPLKPKEVTAAFPELGSNVSNTPAPSSGSDSVAAEPDDVRGYGLWALICLGLAVVASGLAVMAFNSGKKIGGGTNGVVRGGNAVFGPYKVSKVNRPMKIELTGEIPNNSWVALEIDAKTPAGKIVPVLKTDLSRYSGNDRGAWSDNKASIKHIFLPSSVGDYKFRVKYSDGPKIEKPPAINVHMTVKQGVFLARYFIYLAIGLAIVGVYLGAQTFFAVKAVDSIDWDSVFNND